MGQRPRLSTLCRPEWRGAPMAAGRFVNVFIVSIHIPSRIENTIVIIINVLFALVIATILWFQMEGFWLAYESLDWPAVDGRVLQSEVKKGSKGFYVKVRYSYLVDGENLENDTIAFGVFRYYSMKKSDAEKIVSKYSKDQGVKVVYDPAQPGVSCLERGGVGWEDTFVLVVMVGLVVTGLYIILKSKKGADKIRAESP